METTQSLWDSMMAVTTLFAYCTLHAMHCLESKIDWPYTEDERYPGQTQISYQIWECLMEPSPNSRPRLVVLLLTHRAELTNYPQRPLNALCN